MTTETQQELEGDGAHRGKMRPVDCVRQEKQLPETLKFRKARSTFLIPTLIWRCLGSQGPDLLKHLLRFWCPHCKYSALVWIV